MITLDELRELSKAPEKDKAYYRPLICNGDLNKADIFFVGTNPATPIYEKDLDLNLYLELLLNYDKFIDFYKELRIKQGKSEFSRTRIGMNSFLNWLVQHTDSTIIETEAIPYPTDKLKTLWKEPDKIIQKGKDIFVELVLRFSPKLVILHGKETVDQVVDSLVKREIEVDGLDNLNISIEEMEKQAPLFTITYPNGKRGVVVACRHFMYYGNKGDSFSGFRENVLKLIEG